MTNSIIRFYPSLAGRLSLILAIIFVVFALVSVSFMVLASRNYEQEVSQKIHQDLAQFVVDHYLFFKDGEVDLAAVEHTFHDLMLLGPNFEFYLLDLEGKILAFSAKPDLIKRESVDTEAFVNWRDKVRDAGYLENDDPRNVEGKKVFSVAPVLQEGQQYGYLYAVIGSQIRDQLEQELLSSRILQWGLSIFGLIAGFTLLVLLAVVAWATLPLSKLTRQIKEVRQKGFSRNDDSFDLTINSFSCWDPASHNDIHILGHTFKLVLDNLQQEYKNVVSIDDLRKELLSHVSHDLRTPLASLLGYLETWEMQQAKLSPAQSSEYISIAKKSAQRISILVEQLFELAHLDGKNVQVNIERFSIAELIQDVLQKFDIQAQEKNIRLSVTPQDSAISARADIEKMERVFTNLLENALRHTPENGNITVKIEQASSFVSIHVSDTGIGIPEEDLPYIFDAHFKAENSVRENTAHGGLGLAITKKLLDLQESVIRVTSELNRGTTFSFALPSG